MSHDAVNWALKIRGLKPATKLVLLAIADRINKDTATCFPSHKKIAEDAEVSVATAKRHIEQLIKAGLVVQESRSRDGGGATSNLYRIPNVHQDTVAQNELPPGSERNTPLAQNERRTLEDLDHKNLTKEKARVRDDGKMPFTEGWQPSDDVKSWGRAQGYSDDQLEQQRLACALHYMASGQRYACRSALFKSWLINGKKPKATKSAKRRPLTGDELIARMGRV